MSEKLYGSRDATRAAFAAELIENGEVWMEMIKHCNESSHTCNDDVAGQIMEAVLTHPGLLDHIRRDAGSTVSMIILQRNRRGAWLLWSRFASRGGVFEAGEVAEEGDEGFAVGPVVFDFGFEAGAAAVGSPVGLGEFEKLLGLGALEAAEQAVVIKGEQGEEAVAVGLWVVGGGQEQAEDGGAAEDERLAPPPFSETAEGLGAVRLALIVGFLGEAGDGELGFSFDRPP